MTLEQAQAQDQSVGEQPIDGQDALDAFVDEYVGSETDEITESDSPDDVQEEEPKQVQQVEQIDPPQFYSKEQKERFAKLPPEAQRDTVELVKAGEAFTTKKSQALSDAQKRIDAYGAWINMLETDPNYREHALYKYDRAQQGKPQVEAPPEDPIERIKWETEQQIMSKIAPVIQRNQQQAEIMLYQQMIQETKQSHQRDPQYAEVHQKIGEFVTDLPGRWDDPTTTQGKMWLELDRNPDAYAQMFQKFKAQIKSKGEAAEIIEQGKTRTTKTPVLEKSGKMAQSSEEASVRSKRNKELYSKIKNKTADPDEIGDYLESSGLIDKIMGK
jgi:hypothetical protein